MGKRGKVSRSFLRKMDLGEAVCRKGRRKLLQDGQNRSLRPVLFYREVPSTDVNGLVGDARGKGDPFCWGRWLRAEKLMPKRMESPPVEADPDFDFLSSRRMRRGRLRLTGADFFGSTADPVSLVVRRWTDGRRESGRGPGRVRPVVPCALVLAHPTGATHGERGLSGRGGGRVRGKSPG